MVLKTIQITTYLFLSALFLLMMNTANAQTLQFDYVKYNKGQAVNLTQVDRMLMQRSVAQPYQAPQNYRPMPQNYYQPAPTHYQPTTSNSNW